MVLAQRAGIPYALLPRLSCLVLLALLSLSVLFASDAHGILRLVGTGEGGIKIGQNGDPQDT